MPKKEIKEKDFKKKKIKYIKQKKQETEKEQKESKNSKESKQEEITEVIDDKEIKEQENKKENTLENNNKFIEEFSFNQFSKTKPLSLERVVEKENKNINQIDNFQEQFSSQSEKSQEREEQKNLYQDYTPNIYESEKRQIQENIDLIARAEKIEPTNFSLSSPITSRSSNLIINPELQEIQRQSQQKTDRDYIAKSEKLDRGKIKLPFEKDLTEDYNIR